jgi:hypothetical protein
MKFLLPNRYKKVGVIIAPSGFLLWLAMQLGYITRFLIFFFGEPRTDYDGSSYHIVNIIMAIAGFFSFLAGIYFITFSKERVEDEMVQRTRLDSFQFAALTQILLTIAGFICMLLVGDPGESGMMLFFIGLVFLFWLVFIGRFNYILHIRYRQ